MRVAVIGGGLSGPAIGRALQERGAGVDLLSRSSGYDVLRDPAPARLRSADAIVEATGRFTMRHRVASAFFTRSTRNIAAIANASGAKHVLLSIVNCEVPEVQGYGYFAGKAAQERTARAVSEHLEIVRSTQWFEFAGQSLERLRVGPVALVPSMTIKPVALSAVAAVLADRALAPGSGVTLEISGPEVTTLWKMTTSLPRGRSVPVPFPLPGVMGRSFRNGSLLPDERAEIVGPTFLDWRAADAELAS